MNASQFFTELNRIQSFLSDTNNSLQSRYDLFNKVQEYLPIAYYLSDHPITNRSSSVYIESITDYRRGILSSESMLVWVIDDLYEHVPEDFRDPSMTLEDIIKHSTHPAKELEVARVEAIVSEGKGGVAINW